MSGELKNWVAVLGLGSGAAVATSAQALETPSSDQTSYHHDADGAQETGKGGAAKSLGLYVVINHEEQFTVWPKARAIPKGWSSIGKSGDAPKEAVNRLLKRVNKESRYVVINHEEQYSLWPAGKTLPPKWKPLSTQCEAAKCGPVLHARLEKSKIEK